MKSETNSQFMRAWTKCYRTQWTGVTLRQFVDHFDKYKKWFYFESFIMPGRKIFWRDDE